MPIDKLTPRFLVSDKDERLLKEGAMTDALNVTISEDGDGSEGIVKNIKGTDAASPEAGLTLGTELTVIGQVSDPQRGFIYFFVAGDSDANHAIYQYNAKSTTNDDLAGNTYREVFKNSWLDFQADGFVKADVLNGAFQQDGVIQTILYFTDNNNQPRKINVDRALLGDYDGLSDTKLDHALRCIKSAPIDVPTFSFETDSTIDVNNFTNNLFQFALQYVYKDGEESAISGYSALAYPEVIPLSNIENASTGRQYYEDNVCVIDTNWSSNVNSTQNIPDVEKLRILGRQGNSGSFFVIDEFNPNQDLTRVVLGDSEQVYNSDSGTYRFYNDGVYSSVANTLVDKLYDNVPLKAQGQAISSNRLFYSDYVEGFENTSVSATIQVGYSADRFGGSNSTSNSVSEYSTTDKERGRIEIDCDSMFSSTNVPAGSKTTISFDWDAEGSFSYESADDYAIEITAAAEDGTFVIGFGNKQPDGGSYDSWSGGVILKKSGSTDFNFVITIINEEEVTVNEFADLLNEAIGNFYWSKTYQASDTQLRGVVKSSSSSNFPNGYSFTPDAGNYDVTTAWHFNTSSVVSNNTVVIVPTLYFASIDIDSSTGAGGYTYSITPQQSFNSGSNLLYHINNDVTSSFPFGSSAAWHETLDATDTYLSNPLVSSSAFFSQSTFKAGCMHDLGVVYYDKHNRSGNVNKIGSFYVEPFSDTTGSPRETGVGTGEFKNGASYVTVNFTSEPPDWAERYQIVYPGMSTYSSVVQYTTGPAFFDNPGGNADLNNKRIYVSLRTLSNYQDQKAAQRSYSYTEGDKLRVISADTATGTSSAQSIEYLKANDGSIIEFNVVGVVILPQDGVAFHNTHETSATADVYEGEFLVLEAPAVAAGLETEVSNSATNLKYPGFDWFSISGEAYPGTGGTPTQLNRWGDRCVVEILTPRRQTSEKIYYEIGESRKVGGYKASTGTDHGPSFVVNSGDVHFTPISCLTPWRDGSHTNEHVDNGVSSDYWNHLSVSNWKYEDISLESMSVSDFFSSRAWDKGRPHIVFESAAEVRRLNGITYSDAYAEDVANLSLSSFNPSLGNFDSVDSRFGALEYIGNYNDDLVGLQENKLCLIPVKKNIIEYASGSSDVAVSTNVLGQRRYSAGDYGSGGHPEAVLVQDNSVYFVDESRQAVCVLTGGQLVPISEKGMSSFFEDFFTNSHTRYVSGYDPRVNTFYLTGLGGTDETVGYDVARGAWQSKYSFTPDVYANQNNMLYSANYISGNNIFWKHDSSTYNTFYGTAADSVVQVVSKISPSRVKIFKAMSYEGDAGNWDVVGDADIKTDLNQETGGITSWRENEGSYYAAMPRDKSSNSTSEEVHIGDLTLSSDTTYTVAGANLNRLHIPLNVDLTIAGDTRQVTSYTSNTITFDTALTTPGTNMKLEIAGEGDVIRGHFSKIKLTLPAASATTKQELYCINTHIADSKSHHPLGQ
jgi:hypothetical protein